MLTPSQQKTFEFIQRFILQNGQSPSMDEIAFGIGIKSRGVVHRYVHAIAEEGLINLLPGRRRNIELVGDIADNLSLPIIGKIAAGGPIEAIEDRRVFNLASTLLGHNRFILEVKGDSMIGDNICDGDYIICEKSETARDGNIIVALIDNEDTTLKRLQRNGDNTVTLLPSNPSLKPMLYEADRVQVQALYLGLLRVN